jgi:hypothetical protein
VGSEYNQHGGETEDESQEDERDDGNRFLHKRDDYCRPCQSVSTMTRE